MNSYPLFTADGKLIGRMELTDEAADALRHYNEPVNLSFEYTTDRILSFSIVPGPAFPTKLVKKHRDAYTPCLHHEHFRYIATCSDCVATTLNRLIEILDGVER